MTTYLSNRNSDGKTDENGHFRLPLKVLDGEVLEGFEVEPGTGLQVVISEGEAKIPYSDYAYAVWSDANENLTIPTASTTAGRIDTIVAYVDRTMTFEETDVNHPGALKFKVVQGTPASSPTPATEAQIQTAVGAGNPYIILALVTVPMNATAILSANIDNSAKTKLSLAESVTVPNVTGADGSNLKFMVINEGDDLPEPIEDTTLVVLVAKNN